MTSNMVILQKVYTLFLDIGVDNFEVSNISCFCIILKEIEVLNFGKKSI